MTNRFAGCVRRIFLKIKISQMQYDRGILLHERPQPHPSCRPSSTPGDRRGGTPRRDSRKKAGAPTAVRRSRAGQRRHSIWARPTYVEARARPSKRLRTRESSEAGPEAHRLRARISMPKLARSMSFPSAPENLSKSVTEEHEKGLNTDMFAANRRANQRDKGAEPRSENHEQKA